MKARKAVDLAVWTGVITLVVALAAFAVAGCGSTSQASDNGTGSTITTPDGDATPSAIGGALTAITQADNGKTFTLGVGDSISVILEGNPTTGYAWEPDLSQQDAALLTLASGDPYTADPVGTDVVGSGGKYTFTFTATAAGQAELKLKYWRSFEPDTEPLETFSVNITIK